MKSVSCLTICLLTLSAQAELTTRTVTTELDGTTLTHTLVYDAAAVETLPALLMVPNWLGPTEASLEKASKIADMGFVVLMADMYGVDVRPKNAAEAARAAGTIRNDRPLQRARANHALETLRQQADVAPINRDQLVAIGFCFGGGTVLELARSSADIDLVVSFHGDLVSPTLEPDSRNITASVLVLHGADDPFVPPSHVMRFTQAMDATEVDYTFVSFANTVHSFTDPYANMPGKAEFDADANRRAFAIMQWYVDDMFAADLSE